MAINTEKYIRKPLYVDAVRVTAANFDEIVAWCQGEVQTDDVPGSGTSKKYIKVRVHNPKNPRQTKAFVGDWLLYTERGYKVYTNKAFRAAFDEVTAQEAPLSDPRLTGDPVADASAEEVPAAPAVLDDVTLHSVGPVTGTPGEDPGVGEITEVKEPGLQQAAIESGHPVDPTEPIVDPVVGEKETAVDPDTGIEETYYPPPMSQEQARESLGLPEKTPQGEDIEVVAATPQAIADTVAEQQEPRLQTETGAEGKIKHEPVFSQGGGGPVPLDEDVRNERAKPVTHQPPQVAASGKRVLSPREQREMEPAEVRELLRSGEAVLAQDLA